MVFCELDNMLDYKRISNHSRKKHKHSKPYWNANLDSLWREMVKHEKKFVKYKGKNRTIKSSLRNEFKVAQRLFDCTLTKTAREYNRSQVNEIEEFSSNNPKEFWRKLKSLGPRKHKDIPIKIVDGDNVIIDKNEVLSKWKDTFSALLNGSADDNNFDNVFHEEARLHKIQLEKTNGD